jgi:hypothetical protein
LAANVRAAPRSSKAVTPRYCAPGTAATMMAMMSRSTVPGSAPRLRCNWSILLSTAQMF